MNWQVINVNQTVMLLLFLSLLLTACSGQTPPSGTERTAAVIGNPTAEEILQQSKDADIFMFDDIVYVNADNLDWVQQLQIGELAEIGKIQTNYREGTDFINEMSTKLPIGTIIYEPTAKQGPVLIAEIAGKPVRYLGLLEG
ncbi:MULTISPECIES: hypothetical protein [unclassified Paenibacillus]|uniref:hypothetical protein n=1 Tax=unclassified Paenibacillus TaxID=185978 RepID=UPI001C0FC5B8|nr:MULTISPECIES: hypothetical protein [unclassified Paenibacillus]MBU5445081.1 hypothetical protein [Paenibacillus sp. MSJ-34]